MQAKTHGQPYAHKNADSAQIMPKSAEDMMHIAIFRVAYRLVAKSMVADVAHTM